jgi:DNA polymerase-3 subunit delta'
MGVFFKDIIGQRGVVEQLRRCVDENRLAHALLITGPRGNGKLAVAIALANYLLCGNRKGDVCGNCPSCVKLEKFIHSDLHFVFPVKKRKGSDSAPISDDYITEWREMLAKGAYFSYDDWLQKLDVENQQPMIYERESNEILHKLSMQSREGGWKIVIIWLPEKMKEACSNKLLKIIEEPPQDTLFLLVSEEPDKIIPTIQSRTQCIAVPRITQEDMEKALYRNRIYLNRRFKAVMGCSIWEYTLRKRIFTAQQQLYLTRNISEAFRASGFQDYSVFFRHYKKYIGVSPSEELKNFT